MNGFRINAREEKTHIKEKISHFLGKFNGLNRLNAKYSSEIDTLYYFLNTFCDVTQIPSEKCGGESMKNLQQCDAVLLKIFDNLCKRNDLVYWLDWGTLLGAVRHSGFIPWDDDLDVSMPREDYNKALLVLPAILERYNLELRVDDNASMERFGIGYQHDLSGIWLDVFPVDEMRSDADTEAFMTCIIDAASHYGKYYKKNKLKKNTEQLLAKKKSIFENFTEGEVKWVYSHPEFIYPKIFIAKEDIIFPLGQLHFEGYNFPVPQCYEEFLEILYGKNYMKFPRSGVEHHGRGEEKLYERAGNNNFDMKEALHYLKKVETQVS